MEKYSSKEINKKSRKRPSRREYSKYNKKSTKFTYSDEEVEIEKIDPNEIQRKLDEEMEKRKLKLEEWKSKMEKIKQDEIENVPSEPVSTWTFESDNEVENIPSEPVSTWTFESDNEIENIPGEAVSGCTFESEDEINKTTTNIGPNSEKLAVSQASDHYDLLRTITEDSNINQTDASQHADEIDPLDAFMTDLSEKLNQELEAGVKLKGSTKLKVVTGSSQKHNGKNKFKMERPEIMEPDQDLMGYSSEHSNEKIDDDITELANKIRNKKSLNSVDHSLIQYMPFRKNFYVEVPEITQMTPGEVAKLCLKLENVRARGKNCPRPVIRWSQMGISFRVLEVLKKYGFEKPTPIQAQSIPCIMSGRDVIGIAKTGSGKTLAFVLPMLRHILDQPCLKAGDGPIALIMAPTRELAYQIHSDCLIFTKPLQIRCVPICGGVPMADQINDIKKKAEVVVCTPGRMIEILSSGKVFSCKRISLIILDEADRMFDLGFEPQVMKIIDQIRPDRQTVMFSATFPKIMEALAKKILTKPIEVQVGARSSVCNDVEQHILHIEDRLKFFKLLEILGIHKLNGSVLIFVDKQESADMLLSDLMKMGYPCLALHGGMDQFDRENTIESFKNKICDILIATSVAARGLDVKDLNLVVNYDCPNHYEDYVHRCGRTGRAGKKGVSITFISSDEINNAGDIIMALEHSKIKIPESLKELWEEYIDKMRSEGKTIKRKGNGFRGKGFQFTDEESKQNLESKKVLKWSIGLQDSDDEAEEEQTAINKIEQDIDKVFNMNSGIFRNTNSIMISEQDIQDRSDTLNEDQLKVDQGKMSVAQQIAERLNKKLTSNAESNNLSNNTPVDDAMSSIGLISAKSNLITQEFNSSFKLSSKNLAQQLAQKINAKLNYSTTDRLVNQNESNEREFYTAEIDINDFPQQVRWKITSKETVESITQITDTFILVKGSYVPPNKTPEQVGVDRRLYLVIEAPTEFKIQLAKAEIKRVLKEELLRLETGCWQQYSGRYTVL